MEREWNENHVLLRGVAQEAPVFSHENRGERYTVFPLAVKRLSGTVDTLPVLASSQALAACPVKPGMSMEVEGELRSFNNKSGKGRRLVLSVFARRMAASGEPDQNHLILEGVICKKPALRRTPLGREICDFILAVNRKYGRADYLPCISWGHVAAQTAALEVGSQLRLEGRMQSRTYIKVLDGESTERTAFEVSVMRLEKWGCSADHEKRCIL